MKNTVNLVILGILALACFAVSFMQFMEKGYLLNNSYIFADKKEREKMNKKPYYRQSGIVFILLGLIFLIGFIDVLLKKVRLSGLEIAIGVVTIAYSIISSLLMEKKNK